MITAIHISKQRGVALVLALLLLFVLVTIGVAGFGNTHLQERSASNARLQAEAFKAASAGATNSINFFQDNRDRTDIGIPDQLCGASGHEGWYDADDNPIPSDWVAVGNIGEASLQQRLYCLADFYPCTKDAVDCGVRPPRSQLFVQSRGEVTVDSKIVASRDVEVRLAKGQEGVPGDGCGAICFPTCDINTDDTVFPNSNSFQVDGNTGPAITVGTGCDPSGADTITDMIKDQRIGNYVGGIEDSPAGSPWNSPLLVEQFRAEVQAAAAAAADCANCYHPTGLDTSGNVEFGTLEAPQITYIDSPGADIGGSISGAGILVVNGDLLMNGTPDYQGLIVVLGGEWIIDGGGKGGNPGSDQTTSGGSVVVLNAPGSVDGSIQPFGEITFDNTGGGNALYRYDCEVLQQMRQLLSLEAQDIWQPTCNPVPDLFFLGPERIIIASWRENIGWREELFAD